MAAPASGQAGPQGYANSQGTGEAAQRYKRAADILGSAVLLLLAFPLLTVLGVLILICDGAPVFYRRRVTGPAGEFDAFKLRTMRTDADEVLHRDPELRQAYEINFKLQNDPRVTALGAFLRKASLDELPQLWNVMKGQMSLVGPRMITPAELMKYGDAAWIFRQFKPGLTGYWQIHGRQNTSYAERVEMDLFYARNWSMYLDLKIILMTPWRVIQGAGAY
ncbi:MAG TPA: sugar transferase [Candidatus Angelobacter sp.]|nr:sugar transferase [Candidatus Angelobacter sp.]